MADICLVPQVYNAERQVVKYIKDCIIYTALIVTLRRGQHECRGILCLLIVCRALFE